ncbi:MAG: MoxR family ATPase [Bacteroidetes bacterium]|nr:MoxR family ATPase [Bacteroidota bacterium]
MEQQSILGNGEMQADLTFISNKSLEIKNEIGKVIVGQDRLIELMLVGIYSGGHILLEGVPGIAKTLAAKLLSKTISTHFSRIQFTPDLMPSDVTGTSVFNLKSSEFNFVKGPIFSNIVLIDEINRSPAKTQAALFEVMEERQITTDGQTYKMDYPFFVLATQNPIEQEGTYKLPEAQLDRFLFKIKLAYPTLEEEKQILVRFKEGKPLHDFEVKASISVEDLKKCADIVNKVYIKDEILSYIASIVNTTRNHSDIFLGASPRASLAIMKTSKAVAAMRGRSFVIPEDVQFVAYPVLNHRIILTSEKEMEGAGTEDVIKNIIQTIEVPR